jgi:GTP-binding protein HflX
VQRKARGRGELLNVSLVGYTNAGKSTLFNALTHAGVYAADQLFATLDTTTRKLWLPDAGHIVLSDTVGFIRNLPHSLVAAFHATLEATAEADLLLHVVDSASPARDDQVADVNKVLVEIGAADVPQLMVLNKLDLTGLPPASSATNMVESARSRQCQVPAKACRCCATRWPSLRWRRRRAGRANGILASLLQRMSTGLSDSGWFPMIS